MPLFILACIGVIAWLLLDRNQAKAPLPGQLMPEPDATPADTNALIPYLPVSNINFNLDPDVLPNDLYDYIDRPLINPDGSIFIPPVLNPNGGRP